ncbi:hypothetical protein U9M48_025878 [Paspalum notatum var. saurae]|uniref:Uncharacterized protein n=1 Tax=Paspalum notatum var. saurae TaxID=547442 RepID=A0AAQ3WY67_PASNO
MELAMSAAPARAFSSTVEPLLLPASMANGGGRRGGRLRVDSFRPPSAAASKTLPLTDDRRLNLQLHEGLTNVRVILHRQRRRQKSAGGREMMVTVDNLKRLCIDHYFEEEIHSAMGACMDLLHSDDLFDATLAFRLMREAGHHVSAADDVLRRFTGDGGEFKLALSKDIRGLLSLHDMSHLSIGGEDQEILSKAKEFSRKHLASAIRHLQPSLARYVRQSLDHPYHLNLMQYKARHHLSYLQSLTNRDDITTAMEELAAAEFQLNKLLHQKEMQEITRWWMDLGLAQEIPVARDQVLKWYMWCMACLQRGSFSRYRVEMTKIISLVYVVDDIFDLVGTQEELSLFAEAIKQWTTAAADSLPSCMRSCYKAIYTVTNEIADRAEKGHGFNPGNHLMKAWAVLFDGFMVEAKWLATDQVPTAEEYLRNGVITSGVPLTLAHALVLLGHDDADRVNEALADDHIIPSVISCPAKILRLWDDLGSAKDEAQEGVDGSYRDFYLLENPRCNRGDAEAHMRGLIAKEWEELNRECFCRRTFSSAFTQACLNIARMVGVMYSYNKEQRLLQEGLTNVHKILHQQHRHQKSAGREVMVAIDNLKRLCIDHYFEEEIQSAMDAACTADLLHSDDLLDATLSFRLMREAGHDVSAADDVLRRFTDGAGEFKLSLSKDIRGLLSLHDISHLNIGGEEQILSKAKEFSSKHLASAIRYLEPGLANYVRQSLDHPYHLSLMQYKARHHLSYLQTLPTRDTAMEELAVAEFQLNKMLHQKEMQEVTRWWMDLGLAQEIPVARDQVMKWYMWSMTALQGSSFSKYRVDITKIISLVYVVDDIFDLVGTPEELSLFNEAIKQWNSAADGSLPSCMRSCYKAIYTITNDIADMAEKEHGLNPIDHLRKAWAVLFDGFMVEAKWLATDQVPTAEEYLRNGAITSGVPLTFAHIFVLLGNNNDENLESVIDHMPPIVSCPAKILRLWDDLGSAEDEAQEGLDGSYRDFYLMENPKCSPGDAEAHMRSLIAREWEELNRECFSRRTFSSSIRQVCLNAARMISVMYSYDKEQRLVALEEYARMLLL